MKELSQILKEISSTVAYTEFVGIISLEEGITLEMWTDKWTEQKDIITAALSEIGRFIELKKQKARNPIIREALKDFIELIIETEKSYFIVQQIEGTNYCIGAGLGKAGNIGLLRSKIKLLIPEIKNLIT